MLTIFGRGCLEEPRLAPALLLVAASADELLADTLPIREVLQTRLGIVETTLFLVMLTPDESTPAY